MTLPRLITEDEALVSTDLYNQFCDLLDKHHNEGRTIQVRVVQVATLMLYAHCAKVGEQSLDDAVNLAVVNIRAMHPCKLHPRDPAS